MRELKEEAALGKGVRVLDSGAALERARDRIDGQRLRRTRGWRTAVEADAALPHWGETVARERVQQEVACGIEESLLHSKGKREERRAIREAILSTLERFGVIQRTRDGRSPTVQSAERLT